MTWNATVTWLHHGMAAIDLGPVKLAAEYKNSAALQIEQLKTEPFRSVDWSTEGSQPCRPV